MNFHLERNEDTENAIQICFGRCNGAADVGSTLTGTISRTIALRGGYRWLDYDLEKDDAPTEARLDMRMEGPFLGIGFKW